MTPLDKLDMRQVRESETGILDSLFALCERHGLTCYLAYGTLIGAARHQGFIPWDDDTDVWMPIEDYRKLIDLVSSGRDQLEGPYRLAAWSIPYEKAPHHLWFAKIYDMSTLVNQDILAKGIVLDEGCWVDVFPYTTVPDEDTWRRLKDTFETLQWRTQQCVFATKPRGNPILTAKSKLARSIIGRKSRATYLDEYERLLDTLPPSDSHPFVYDPAAPQTLFDAEWFREATTLPFEGKSYPVPAGWRQILERFYGDWKTLPPEDKRVSHGFTAYRRPEQQ